MDKTKFAILVALLLALIFFSKMDAEASVESTLPDVYMQVVGQSTIEGANMNYQFYVGADDSVVVYSDSTDSEGNIFQANTIESYAAGTAIFSFDTGNMGSYEQTSEYMYAYDGYRLAITPYYTNKFSYNSNDLSSYKVSAIVRPYAVVQGTKYYLTNNSNTSIYIDAPISTIKVYYGAEVDIIFAYDGYAVTTQDAKSLFATCKFNLTFSHLNSELSGYRNISTEGQIIYDAISNKDSGLAFYLNKIWSKTSDIYNRFNVSLSSVRDNIVDAVNTLQTNLLESLSGIDGRLSTLDFNIGNLFVSLFDKMSSWQTALDTKLDDVIEAITKSYDSSGAESTNTVLTETLDSWEAAEGATMSDAKIEVSSYDTSSAFDFAPALVSSMTLITTFANGFFRASGDFSTALIVMIALVFVSCVVGLIRFVK